MCIHGVGVIKYLLNYIHFDTFSNNQITNKEMFKYSICLFCCNVLVLWNLFINNRVFIYSFLTGICGRVGDSCIHMQIL